MKGPPRSREQEHPCARKVSPWLFCRCTFSPDLPLKSSPSALAPPNAGPRRSSRAEARTGATHTHTHMNCTRGRAPSRRPRTSSPPRRARRRCRAPVGWTRRAWRARAGYGWRPTRPEARGSTAATPRRLRRGAALDSFWRQIAASFGEFLERALASNAPVFGLNESSGSAELAPSPACQAARSGPSRSASSSRRAATSK